MSTPFIRPEGGRFIPTARRDLAPAVLVRAPPQFFDALNSWIDAVDPDMTRAEALRRLAWAAMYAAKRSRGHEVAPDMAMAAPEEAAIAEIATPRGKGRANTGCLNKAGLPLRAPGSQASRHGKPSDRGTPVGHSRPA
jgi:hypothetical protein